LYQLINHTSRLPFLLPNTLNLSRHPPDSIPYLVSAQQKNYSKESFLSDLHGVTLDTIPGTKYGYSNAASQLLGFILEKIYGSTYPQLLQQYILLPTGMRNTRVSTGEKTATFATATMPKGFQCPTTRPSC
jgi:CubicO group peptidase (beta-lactamase class C family)